MMRVGAAAPWRVGVMALEPRPSIDFAWDTSTGAWTTTLCGSAVATVAAAFGLRLDTAAVTPERSIFPVPAGVHAAGRRRDGRGGRELAGAGAACKSAATLDVTLDRSSGLGLGLAWLRQRLAALRAPSAVPGLAVPRPVATLDVTFDRSGPGFVAASPANRTCPVPLVPRVSGVNWRTAAVAVVAAATFFQRVAPIDSADLDVSPLPPSATGAAPTAAVGRSSSACSGSGLVVLRPMARNWSGLLPLWELVDALRHRLMALTRLAIAARSEVLVPDGWSTWARTFAQRRWARARSAAVAAFLGGRRGDFRTALTRPEKALISAADRMIGSEVLALAHDILPVLRAVQKPLAAREAERADLVREIAGAASFS